MPLLLCGFALLCGAPSLSWCQDFKDSEVYQVSGAQLNKLQADLLTAKKELETLQTENAQKVKDLDALQAQLQTVSTSFKTSQNEALATDIKIGAACLLTGAAIGWLAHH